MTGQRIFDLRWCAFVVAVKKAEHGLERGAREGYARASDEILQRARALYIETWTGHETRFLRFSLCGLAQLRAVQAAPQDVRA